jgi:hypothetical protein
VAAGFCCLPNSDNIFLQRIDLLLGFSGNLTASFPLLIALFEYRKLKLATNQVGIVFYDVFDYPSDNELGTFGTTTISSKH